MGIPAAPAYLKSPANLQEVLREVRRMADDINHRLDQIIARLDRTHRTEIDIDNDLRKRLLAINMLLEMPEDLDAALESELYALRDKLQVAALEK